MTPPDWQTLFLPRPLAERAQTLTLGVSGPPIWMAVTQTADLLPPEEFLSATEMARASAFKFAPPREHFLLGRLAAKLALAAKSGTANFVNFEIRNGERGQPLVEHPTDCQSGVTITHGGGMAVALAFPRDFPLGVDLEVIDASRAATVRAAVKFSPAERVWLKAGGVQEDAACLLLWAAREAFGKLLGTGLSVGWDTLRLRSLEAVCPGIWRGLYDHQAATQCWLWAGKERVLAISMPGESRRTASL